MMKTKIFMLILAIFLIGGMTQAAVVQVAAGTDVLKPAIDAATAGDIIELTTDGGEYLSNDMITVDKDITIRAAEGLVAKPVVKYVGTSTSGYFFKIDSSPEVNLINLDLDGTAGDGVTKYVKNGLYLANGDTNGTAIMRVLGCDLHGVTEKGFKADSSSGADSVIFRNGTMYDVGREGVCLYSGTSSYPAAYVDYAEISNMTFYGITREAIKAQNYKKMKVRVDRCTFYDIGGTDKAMIYIHDMTDVEVKNSVFQKMASPDDYFADLGLADNILKNCSVWDVANWGTKDATVTDTLHADPMFIDAANSDFTLGNALLFTYADDGGAIGDPRWAPAPPEQTVWQIAEGTGVLSAAISAAADGDIIELTTDGGIYAELAKFPSVSKSISIVAAEGLVNKPIIRTPDADYMLKLTGVDSRYVFKGLEIDGSNGTGAAVAKYFLRIDNVTPTGTMEVIVDDCNIHDFSDKFIKPYGNSGMDSLVVRNSVLYNGGSEGVLFYSGSTSDPAAVIAYGEVSNTTMYNIVREAIKGDTYASGKIVIDRLTAYNCGSDSKGMIYFDDWLDVTVKNSIFVKNTFPNNFGRFESDANVVKNCVIWDVVSWNTENTTSVTDTLHVDPGFADAANGDFTLPEGSPLLTFADDGGSIGDSRWVPGGVEGFLLKAEISGQGSVTRDPDQPKYEAGTSVTLTATPLNENWKFVGWSNNVAVFPPDNPIAVITVNDNMLVTAYFEPVVEKYESVVIGSVGLGHVDTVRFSDYAIPGFFEGDSVILTAVADTSTWAFDYWANAAGKSISTDNPLTWIVDGDSSWIAMFSSTITQYALTDSVEGRGQIFIDPKPVAGFETYDAGTAVTLIARAYAGWEFAGWKGDLTGTDDSITVTMNADVLAIAEFAEINVPNGELAIGSDWDLRDALEFAKYNSQVEKIVLVSTGPYMPDESDRVDGKLPRLDIDFPVTIVGADTMASKAVIKGWGEGSSDGMIQFTGNTVVRLKNLVMDGYFGANKTKYIFRSFNSEMTYSLFAEDVEFFGTTEVFLKNYAPANVDTLSIVNCVISDIGKEGIYDQSAGTANYIEILNTTFYDVAREVFRLKAWTPKMVVDHVTVHHCGFGTGPDDSKYAAFKLEKAAPAVITNCIISDVENLVFGYAVRMYGEEAMIDNILLSPSSAAKIDDNDGSVIGDNVFWYDPMFLDPANNDFTLKDSSMAYHLAGDGSKAVGDLRWATSSNVAVYHALDLKVEGSGEVAVVPEPMGKFYVDGAVVTLTASADTLYKFGEWTGDLTGTDNPATITMDADKSLQASFTEAFYIVELNVDMSYWADLEKFSVEGDSVDMAGTFNGWGESPIWMADDDGDTIYTAAVKIDENYPNIEWKFRINGSWNDATCEFPSGGANRTFTVTQDTSLVFWYNDEEYPITGIVDGLIPDNYSLSQNYPNPFNPTTTIRFSLKKDGFTTLMIYDMLGREVARLVNKDMKAGYHQVVFSDMAGMASGVYIYKLTSGDFSSVKKMMLMK